MPDADVKVCNPTTLLSESASARLMFTATGHWNDNSEVVTSIYDALFALLPVNSVSTFSAVNHTRLSKEFWVNQTPRLPFLERIRLFPAAVKAFRDTLAEDAPPGGPRFPLLTKLTIIKVTWTLEKTYHFRDMLLKRVEQGVPLKSIDLDACEEPGSLRAKEIFAEFVVDVQGSVGTSPRIVDEGDLRTAAGSRKEVEYDSDAVQEPWYGLDHRDGEEENTYECDCGDGAFNLNGINFGAIHAEFDGLDPEDGLPDEW
jgi:hypothetical protein